VALCPAKVNLALRVLSRRADGYHELDTVFQAIDVWDRLELFPRDDPEMELVCDDPTVPVDGTNLVRRAAELLRERSGRELAGASFRLSKSIPVQGGLGGGSSDAAGALVLCARYWELSVSRAELAAMAAELGADVPFFLCGGTARGRGRGDRLEALPFLGPLTMVLGLPSFGVSTREVFDGLGRVLTLPGNGVRFQAFAEPKWPRDNDFSFVANDLERVVFPRWPELRQFRDALLEEGARGAVLSGSGSTVYGIFPEPGHIAAVVERLAGRFPKWRILATRAVEGRAHVTAPSAGVDVG
jgi:4-diphosphocytidyl-2-C-methyl-D-erythritol kinase